MLRSLLSFPKNITGSGDDYIFPTVNPNRDGVDCTKDCANCTVNYPSRLKIDMVKPMYGRLKPFGAHVLVATGKSDWAQKIEDVKGSLPEALHSSSAKLDRGVCPHFAQICILMDLRFVY